MNVANLLRRAGHAFAERTAVALGDRFVYPYRELDQRAASIAYALRNSLGLQPGDRIALAMRNCPQYVELMFAVWHAGLTVVPINAKLHQREFGYILDHAQAKLCFVTSDLADVIDPLRSALTQTLRVICVDDPDYQALAAGGAGPIVD